MTILHVASLTLAALLGSAAVLVPSPAAPAPVPGPGGVAVTVRDFLRAQDAGADLAPFLGGEVNALDLEFDAEGKLGDHQGGVPVFFDIGRDGAAIAAKTAAEFGKAVAAAATGPAAKSELGALRATCQSQECSWAVFAFDRVRTVDGREQRVPMRGTALMRFDDSAPSHFRIYHWHVSPAAPAAAKR